jgi:hypothetical protein
MSSENTITVVVPENGDPFFLPDGAKHATGCLLHRRNRKRVREITQGWHFEEVIDVLDAATG